ncbi:MAG TPA: HPP family protein [Oxalicibacterium sp.]|uniref:HPP family protein n=1 Tax=Oxalicibacterium sp. TaxID=2766525 RepID=UPI002BB98C2D|nr:HPP family protein [Oxalicibacterium sp.]HWU99405.1 HPP family protein [Oxalicibacterium sp.]
MSQSQLQWLARFLPTQSFVDRYERMRACAGALFGIVLTGAFSYLILGQDIHAAWLIAPMGASSVLLFAVPSSPLAQPWSLVGGNLVAALIGVTCAKLIGTPMLAAGVAISLAIGGMFMLKCIHPPSGAVALTAVLGGPAIHAMGYSFVLVPVLLNSLILLVMALFYNNATGRRYPHKPAPDPATKHNTGDLPPTERTGITPSDLDEVLKRYNQVIDISRDDLEELMLKTEMQAYRRQLGEMRCADIMSKDVVTVEFGTDLADAWQRLQQHDLTALPVVDRGNHVIGIVTKADYLKHAEDEMHEGLGKRLAHLIMPSQVTHTDKHEVVGQIMTKEVVTARANQSIVELVPLMSDDELHQVPIVDDQERLVGLISQTDLIAALFENTMADRVLPRPAV